MSMSISEIRLLERRLAAAERERDALREAAGKVTCVRCKGRGVIWSSFSVFGECACPDCADLRRLLEVLR